jgi:hypothetical protein
MAQVPLTHAPAAAGIAAAFDQLGGFEQATRRRQRAAGQNILDAQLDQHVNLRQRRAAELHGGVADQLRRWYGLAHCGHSERENRWANGLDVVDSLELVGDRFGRQHAHQVAPSAGFGDVIEAWSRQRRLLDRWLRGRGRTVSSLVLGDVVIITALVTTTRPSSDLPQMEQGLWRSSGFTPVGRRLLHLAVDRRNRVLRWISAKPG